MARGTWGGATDPNIFKVTIRYLARNQHCQTGFHLRDVAINDNTEQDVADECAAQLTGTFRQLLAPTDTLEGFDARILGQDTGATNTVVVGSGLAVTDAQKEGPNFIAGCLTLKSEIRKRYGQGRMFLPIASEEWIDNDVFNANGVNQIQQFINALTDHFTGDPVTHDLLMVNAHGILPPRPPTATTPGRPEIPASWYDVTSLRLNTVVTFLRSRKVGVGS